MKIQFKNNISIVIFYLFLVFSAALYIGCGVYSFSGSTLPGHIRTVAVPLFENTTPEFGIDQAITDALIVGITQDNTLKIADERSADSVIKGTITRLREDADDYDREEQVSGTRITVTVQVVFEDKKRREEMWTETWTHWGRYGFDDLQWEDAIQEVADKLTKAILNRTVSGW